VAYPGLAVSEPRAAVLGTALFHSTALDRYRITLKPTGRDLEKGIRSKYLPKRVVPRIHNASIYSSHRSLTVDCCGVVTRQGLAPGTADERLAVSHRPNSFFLHPWHLR
jgi:hypothetical protein